MLKHAPKTIFPLLLAMVALPAAGQTPAPQKVVLRYKAKVGQVVKFKSQANLKIEVAGMTINMEATEVSRVNVIDVGADGVIKEEHQTESSETIINGQKAPESPDDHDKSTISIRPDGTIAAYTSEAKDPEQTKIGMRLSLATHMFFVDKPVGIGDKWTHDQKVDDSLHLVAGHHDYEITGSEKIGDADTFKIKLDYRESEGSPALTCNGTVWLEKSSGDVVRSEFDVDHVPGPGGANLSGKLNETRTEGSPLGDVKGTATVPGTKPEPKKDKTIDETIKDYEKIPGLITLYRKKEAGRETVYAEIKEEQLDKLMMLQATAATGNAEQIVAGDPITDLVFKFSKAGDERLVIVVPNISFKAKPGSPLERSVNRAFADAWLESYRIEARQPDRKSLLINIGDLFRGDISQITQAFSGGGDGPLAALRGGGGYSLDREKTYIISMKSFPDNVTVETFYNFSKSGGASRSVLSTGSALADPRSIPIKVIYNLWALKDDGFRPRLQDPRVGFIYTEFQDFSDDGKDDQTTRFILRWDLRKANPKAAMSPPVKPIVFWLDNAIPTEYRSAVRDGILNWNRAFEKIGFKDAIVVKQMPDKADFDHADMRYNVIRWSTTQSPPYGAIALFRTNPITGQIVNAAITVDAMLTRAAKTESKRLVNPASWFDAVESPILGHDPKRCSFASEAVESAWFGYQAMHAALPKWAVPDEATYTKTFLKIIVSHEMGHILGLFHNFAASTWRSMEELKNPAIVKQGIVASVMDYFPFNIQALKKAGLDYYQSDIGPYDYWAMKYGYGVIDAPTTEAELPALKAIATHTNEPGLAYQNDFFADQFDPYITRFDLGAEPLDYWSRVLEVNRFLLRTVGDRSPDKGASFYRLTVNFNLLLNQYVRAASIAYRSIGGLRLHGNFRGDKGEKPALSPIDSAQQRRALSLVTTYVLDKNAFNLPQSLYTRLAPNPTPDMTSLAMGGGNAELPIRDAFASVQKSALRAILGANTLRRISNNEFKLGDVKDKFTLVTLFHEVGRAVWSELDGSSSIDTLRRQLQRNHLDLLIDMVIQRPASIPDDAKMLAWDQLKSLQSRLKVAKSRSNETYTRVHLAECESRVSRALDVKQVIGMQSAAPMSLLQMLQGGVEAGKGKQ